MTLRWRPTDDGNGPAPDGRRTHPGWSAYCACGELRAMLLPVSGDGSAAVLMCSACDVAACCSSCVVEHGLWPDAIARLRDVWPRA